MLLLRMVAAAWTLEPLSPPSCRCRVAVVDDSDAVRVLLRTLIDLEIDLEFVGEGANGEEALLLVDELAPDVLVLDLAMPQMDGLQVLESLRERASQVRTVVYSGFASPQLAEAARERGAVDVLLKGLPPVDVMARLRSACR